jgi:hypothetical protein
MLPDDNSKQQMTFVEAKKLSILLRNLESLAKDIYDFLPEGATIDVIVPGEDPTKRLILTRPRLFFWAKMPKGKE